MGLPTPEEVAAYPRKQTLDVRAAMAQALAQRINDAYYPTQDGQQLQFAEVFSRHPDPEDAWRAPGTACVLPAAYPMEAARLTPSLIECTWEPAGMPGLALYQVAEIVSDFDIQIKCPTDAERGAFIAGLESMWVSDAGMMEPDGARYGITLNLPEYWGLSATFSLKSVRVIDDAQSAMTQGREAVVTVTGQAAQVVLRHVRPMNLTVRVVTC